VFWNHHRSGGSDYKTLKHTRQIKATVKTVLKLAEIAVGIFFKVKPGGSYALT
jgi:hypothetical protein